MSITDDTLKKAVDAAARADWEKFTQATESESRVVHPTYDELPAQVKDAYATQLRAAALNMYPFIAAQALRDAATRINTFQFGPAAAPYLSAIKAQIKADADEMEGV